VETTIVVADLVPTVEVLEEINSSVGINAAPRVIDDGPSPWPTWCRRPRPW